MGDPRAPAPPGDEALLAAIGDGDEASFVALVERHQRMLERVARLWMGEASLADEILQETWLVVLQGADRFQGRSTVRTWLCGILINLARARLRKERRSVPMSALTADDAPVVDPGRFDPPGHRWAGHWATPLVPWPDTPEARLLDAEVRVRLEESIARLPDPQREVLVLRDVEGWSNEEVCNALGVTDTHSRVLLHRARAKVRTDLEAHFDRKRVAR